VALLTLNVDQVPVSVQTGWPRLLQGIVRLFQTLPAAQKSKSTPFHDPDLSTNVSTERDEILKDDFPLDGSAYDDLDDEEDWAGDDTEWNEENEPEEESDAKDESTAYLEFLNEEASNAHPLEGSRTNWQKAQKFQNLEDHDSDDELGEESLLETPLDKIEPYQLFRDALLSKLTLLSSQPATLY